MVGQHKNWSVIGRSVSPPALPRLIDPWPADRPEHVPAQDPGSDILEGLRGKIIVDASAAAGLVVHLVKNLGLLKPVMQLEATDTERILQILSRAGAKAIQR